MDDEIIGTELLFGDETINSRHEQKPRSQNHQTHSYSTPENTTNATTFGGKVSFAVHENYNLHFQRTSFLGNKDKGPFQIRLINWRYTYTTFLFIDHFFTWGIQWEVVSQKLRYPRSLKSKSGKPLLELTLVETKIGPPIARTPFRCVAMFPNVEILFPSWIERKFRSCWNSQKFNYLLIFQIDFEALKDLPPLERMSMAAATALFLEKGCWNFLQNYRMLHV